MPGIVVVGGSAGAIEALAQIVPTIRDDIDAPILITVHVPPTHASRLPEILDRLTALHVAHATDGEWLRPGVVRIAPPDHHLVVVDGQVRLWRGPRENRHRPAIDVMFRSAARWYAGAAVGVLLSGGAGDGVNGMAVIKAAGGRTIVQDPADALFPDLPNRAAEQVQPDLVVAASRIGPRLSAPPVASGDRVAPAVTTSQTSSVWLPTGYGCPDCSGALWEVDDGTKLQFRCRVGHFFEPDALLDGKRDELEGALWSAINVMEERAELSRRLAIRALGRGYEETARRYQTIADDMTDQAGRIRVLLATQPGFALGAEESPLVPGLPDLLRDEIEVQ